MNEILKDKINEQILVLLEENNQMTLGSIVKNLGISAEKGLSHLVNLKNNGLVKVEPKSKYALNI